MLNEQGKKYNLKVYVAYDIHMGTVPLVSYNLKIRLQPSQLSWNDGIQHLSNNYINWKENF